MEVSYRSLNCGSVLRSCLLLMVSVTWPASAALISVDTNCTLPAAIAAANTDSLVGACPAGSGADTIRLTLGVNLLLGPYDHDGPTGTPSVTSRITIEGNGKSISRAFGSSEFRLLHVSSGGHLTLRDASVSLGAATKGGGIYSRGRLDLVDSNVGGNTAETHGGGLFLDSGSVTTIAGAVISYNTVVSGGATRGGGGIFVNAGEGFLSIAESTLNRNVSETTQYTNQGGGLHAWGVPVELRNSTVSKNEATARYWGRGGGIYANDIEIANSTISGNLAAGTDPSPENSGGGGFFGSGVVRHTTFYGNEVVPDPIAPSAGAAVDTAYSFSEPIVLIGSLLAASEGDHCNGNIIDQGGGNLADDTTCLPSIAGTLTGLEAELKDNGGPTRTHALQAGSPAIDLAGSCALALDQRGAGREGSCDSGAFEVIRCLTEYAQKTVVGLTLLFPICHTTILGPDVVVQGPSGVLALGADYLVTLRDGVEVLNGGELSIAVGP